VNQKVLFHYRFVQNFFSNFFFAIKGSFREIDVFLMGIFSIHSFNLHNLKGNGNAAKDSLKNVFKEKKFNYVILVIKDEF